MSTPTQTDLATLVARLEERISTQDRTIQQLQAQVSKRHLPRQRIGSSLLVFCALVLAISFVNLSVSQAQQSTQTATTLKPAPEFTPLGSDKPDPNERGAPELQTTGQPLLIGGTNAPTVVSDTTSLYNPSSSQIGRRFLRVANYTTNDITGQFNTNSYRIGLIGGVSGIDTTEGGNNATRYGVVGATDSGSGVHGYTTGSGNGVFARSEGALGNGVYAEAPGSVGYGVWGVGGAYGGVFSGGRAPLLLVPGNTVGAPSSGNHSRGEFYVDSQGNLFFCTNSGTPGTWAQLNLRNAFVPVVLR